MKRALEGAVGAAAERKLHGKREKRKGKFHRKRGVVRGILWWVAAGSSRMCVGLGTG